MLLPRFVYFTFHQALPHTFLPQYYPRITSCVKMNSFYKSLSVSITMFNLPLRGKTVDATTSDLIPPLPIHTKPERIILSTRRNDRTTIRKSSPPSKPPPAPRKPILKPTQLNALLKDCKCTTRTNQPLTSTKHHVWTPIRKHKNLLTLRAYNITRIPQIGNTHALNWKMRASTTLKSMTTTHPTPERVGMASPA